MIGPIIFTVNVVTSSLFFIHFNLQAQFPGHFLISIVVWPAMEVPVRDMLFINPPHSLMSKIRGHFWTWNYSCFCHWFWHYCSWNIPYLKSEAGFSYIFTHFLLHNLFKYHLFGRNNLRLFRRWVTQPRPPWNLWPNWCCATLSCLSSN